MKLYHGTSEENKKSIDKNGFQGKMFLTNREETALDYGETCIEVEVDESDLEVDCDLPGQRTLSIESANNYLGTNYESIEEFLDNGYSVAKVK